MIGLLLRMLLKSWVWLDIIGGLFARPLTTLMKNEKKFEWFEECEKTFRILKECLKGFQAGMGCQSPSLTQTCF